MSVPECFWIMGNKCHPDGSIVPDEYKKNGTLYIRKQAYQTLTKEAEAAEKCIKALVQMQQHGADNSDVGAASNALHEWKKLRKLRGEG